MSTPRNIVLRRQYVTNKGDTVELVISRPAATKHPAAFDLTIVENGIEESMECPGGDEIQALMFALCWAREKLEGLGLPLKYGGAGLGLPSLKSFLADNGEDVEA